MSVQEPDPADGLDAVEAVDAVDTVVEAAVEAVVAAQLATQSPAEAHSTVVDGVDVLGAISPSRAGDFMSCPLLYRFRTIDRLPEPFSLDAARGTVVHKVLEDLFDLPAPDRTPGRAHELIVPAWEALVETEPRVAEIFEAEGVPPLGDWLATCRAAVDRYFTLEDPRQLEPAERELYVETLLDSKLLLRGFVDRVDVAPDGAIRIVDYKTGRSPGVGFEGKALFQLKFYALAVWRTRGVLPAMLQLVYLGDGEVIRYQPDEQDLLATERKVEAVWRAITAAKETGDWRPSPSRLCSWCAHQALCPAYGGTPPPLPAQPPPAQPPPAQPPPAQPLPARPLPNPTVAAQPSVAPASDSSG
jgi:putative RecB family exonuclease